MIASVCSRAGRSSALTPSFPLATRLPGSLQLASSEALTSRPPAASVIAGTCALCCSSDALMPGAASSMEGPAAGLSVSLLFASLTRPVSRSASTCAPSAMPMSCLPLSPSSRALPSSRNGSPVMFTSSLVISSSRSSWCAPVRSSLKIRVPSAMRTRSIASSKGAATAALAIVPAAGPVEPDGFVPSASQLALPLRSRRAFRVKPLISNSSTLTCRRSSGIRFTPSRSSLALAKSSLAPAGVRRCTSPSASERRGHSDSDNSPFISRVPSRLLLTISSRRSLSSASSIRRDTSSVAPLINNRITATVIPSHFATGFMPGVTPSRHAHG